jgi:hypothetical protein
MTQPRPFAKWRDGDKIIADKRLPKVARDSEEQGNYWRPRFAGFANADYKITGYPPEFRPALWAIAFCY